MGKDSFILYTSFYEPLKMLSEKQLGKLFRAIFEYQINGNTPIDTDIQMAFAFIKNQLDIDNSKYQERIRKNAQNGKRGGRPPKKDTTDEKADGKNESEKSERFFGKAKKADNDNEYDNDYSIYINGREKVLSENLFKIHTSITQNDEYLHRMYKNSPIQDKAKLIEYIKIFMVVLEQRGAVDRTEEEVISHFANWLPEYIGKESREQKGVNNGQSKSNSTDSSSEERKQTITNKAVEAIAGYHQRNDQFVWSA